jgi:hypothetical protein
MSPRALLAGVLRFAPKGPIGTVGVCLGLLAWFTYWIGGLALAERIHVADCSGPAVAELATYVAGGQASAAVAVLLVAYVVEWRAALLLGAPDPLRARLDELAGAERVTGRGLEPASVTRAPVVVDPADPPTVDPPERDPSDDPPGGTA